LSGGRFVTGRVGQGEGALDSASGKGEDEERQKSGDEAFHCRSLVRKGVIVAKIRGYNGAQRAVSLPNRQNGEISENPQYVDTSEKEEVLPLEEAVVLLREAEEERAAADQALEEVLGILHLKG
jgi:CRISPR/Cas system-associated protein Cas5 (RAMP superfamily)